MTGGIRIRVRGPQGMSTINIAGDATWSVLCSEISEKTGISDFDIKYGYPPQPFNTDSINGTTKLTDIPHNLNGEQFTLVPKDVPVKLSDPIDSTKAASQQRNLVSPPEEKSSDPPDGPLRLTKKKRQDVESDPPEVNVPDLEGIMVLRVMPDDNSCLFRALSSAVLGAAIDGMTELRSIVAQTIQAQPDFYSEGILEKNPTEYCRWIQREDSWGGGIELSILSQHFDVEICSINVQDLRVDKFNEGRPSRCILVYSGIHYDVCSVAPYSGASPEFDRKVFDVVKMDGEEIDGGALAAALELCRGLQTQHYFTDTHSFALKCGQCGESGNGQQWAVQHARNTGHGDFGEAD